MKYLTRSYVEALGLPDIVIKRHRNQGIVFHGDGGCLPLPGPSPYVAGTIFENRLYARSECGLSYDLEAQPWPA